MCAQFQVRWSDDLRIDGGVVDAEHRTLIDLANRVIATEDVRGRLDEFRQLVKSLFRYMENHFDHEEELMRESGYPELERHAARHREIVRDMNELLRRQRDINEYAAALQQYMVDWVVTHIMQEDKKLVGAIRPHDASEAVTPAGAT